MILRFVLAIYEQFWHNSFESSLIINFKRLDIKPLIALEKRLMEASRMGFFIFVWRGISLLLNVVGSLPFCVDHDQKIFGDGLAPFRFLTPFPHRSSRRLRNSVRSDILAARHSRVPSQNDSGRLNLQWSLQSSLNIFFNVSKHVLPIQNGREPYSLIHGVCYSF